MLSANDEEREEQRMSIEEIVDECKTFYFAGKETTANFLTWTLLLLALHKEWQSKARQEVISVFGRHGHPDEESLSKLKIVSVHFCFSTHYSLEYILPNWLPLYLKITQILQFIFQKIAPMIIYILIFSCRIVKAIPNPAVIVKMLL